jgi:transposase
MARPYSNDLRERVVVAVERDGLSRRAVAQRFCVGVSTVIKWMPRWRDKVRLERAVFSFVDECLRSMESCLRRSRYAETCLLDEMREKIWIRYSSQMQQLMAEEQRCADVGDAGSGNIDF